MSITISEARAEQVQDVCTRYTKSFVQPITNKPEEEIKHLFHPEAEWYDHGFKVCRVGHNAILGLHKAFLRCNQPFKAEIKGIYPTVEGAVVEQLWIGRCTNDIIRPDGTMIMKGSGRDFRTHVCMVIKIFGEGKITRIDEYDHRYWDEGVPEQQYTKMTDASLKSGL